MFERSLEQTAAEQLQQAGFFVEREARPGAAKKKGADAIAADLMAWAGDESGELVPEVVVEVKAKLRGPIDGALAQLSRVAAALGARRAFFFDGRWHEADPTFTRFDDAGCPTPTLPLSRARIPSKLVEREIWAIRDTARGTARVGGPEWVDAVLDAAVPGSDATLSRLCENAQTRLTLARLVSADDTLGMPPELGIAMARMLAPAGMGTVFDPMCGYGGLLWAAAAAAAEKGERTRLLGWTAAERQLAVARRLGKLCDVSVALECRSLESMLAGETVVDGAICALPFGVRLAERVQLADGSRSADLDVVMLDRIAHWLRPGGRAVIAVPPRVLFADSAAPLRAHLANTLRVVAVIELPGGVLRTTNVPIGVVVLERSAPGDTLVARLRADWPSQIAPSGDLFRAYQQHLAKRAT